MYNAGHGSLRVWRLATWAMAFGLASSSASACQLCTLAEVWSIWPPLLPIGAIALLWLFVSVVHRWVRLPHFVWWAVPLLGIEGFLYLAALSAGGLLLLPYYLFYSLSLFRKHPRMAAVQKNEIRIAAAAALLMLVPVAAQLLHPQAHDELALIRQWPDTGPARIVCRQIAKAEPLDLPKIRRAVEQTRSPSLWEILDKPLIEQGNGLGDQLQVLKRWDTLFTTSDYALLWSSSGLGELLARSHGMPKDPQWSPRQWRDWLTSGTAPTVSSRTMEPHK